VVFSLYSLLIRRHPSSTLFPYTTLFRSNVSMDQLTYLGEHQTQAVNEINTIVHGSIFIIQLNEEFEPNIANEIEELTWLNRNNYTKYQWAHLAEEFVQPWWLKLL